MTQRGEMPFLDHLEELRWRILWSLLAIVVGTALGWWLLDRIDVIEILKRPIAPYLPGGRLVFTSPAEPFMLTLKVAFGLGCVLASPIVIYQVWAFLAPALYERERRIIVPALAVGALLFLGGAVACYQWLLPAALRVLLNFQPTELTPMITIDRYFGMAIPFVIACGIVAELPLVVTILASLGIVTPQFLSRQRRYAIVIAAFLAALLTPPDAVSMVLMLGPLLLLYEVSIGCAWIASRRRARRLATTTLALVILGTGALDAQDPPPAPPPRPPVPQRPVARDTGRARTPPPQDTTRGQSIDTSEARRLGLPTAPTRTFPPPDQVIDSLLKLEGFRITRYVAETLVVQGDSQTIHLRHEALVERDSTQVEADSVRYHEASCRLDASGDPHLFDRGTVLIGEGMRYDTCLRRGTVRDALTDFQQGGAQWFVRGNIAADSGNRRVYVNDAEFTSDPQPVPDYHFSAGQVKWINKRTMVARPAVLYVRDVPIMWLPFIFQDIRGGRRSGILFPRFGLNDLVRPTRSYSRHVTDLGYYFVINDYMDALVTADWFAGRNVSVHAQTQYRWIDRFMSGRLSFTRTAQLDQRATNTRIAWSHSQRFNSTTDFNASVDYATSGRVILRNSLDPYEVTAQVGSNASFNKRFGWGTFNVGGNRRQDLSTDNVSQTFPVITLTPAAVTLAPWLTWSPGFTLSNTQTFNNPGTTLLVPPAAPGDTTADTLRTRFGDRRTSISVQTPIRIGRWQWNNSITILDVASNKREEFRFRDTTGAIRRALFGETFETQVDWQTGISLPPLFTGTWKLQPGVSIINTTAGPYMLRNQFSGGDFVQQGKRLAFSLNASPTFFGFFPGFGPLSRIRHSISPLVSYQYAPGARVPDPYVRAFDPTGTNPNARRDPQQTISLGLSQNFEAKLKPPPGDTTSEQEARKIRLLSINTSAIGYNFEQAKDSGRVGWQTQTLNNSFASDLLPGFQLSIAHDLWLGQVGSDTAKFDPFLQSINASFQITPQTLGGIARMLGLTPRPARPAPQTDTTAHPAPGAPGMGSPIYRDYQGASRNPFGGAGLDGGYGRDFNLSVNFTSSRSRFDTPEDKKRAGRQTAQLNLAFSPTRNWTANWRTTYDIVTKQFADHSLTFQRDLRRWRASFSFYKTGTGNLAFSFNITLTDQPDIKFDYDQRTYVQ